MKPIGVVVAMTTEARGLVKKKIVTDEMIRLSERAVLQLSGMGAQSAERAANNLVKHGAVALLSWGTAGALTPDLSPGSVVLPNIVMGVDQCFYPTHLAWHENLVHRLKDHLRLYQGTLAEGITVLKNSSEKRALSECTGAIAVDLESCSVAKVAHEAYVPFMAIRAIADPSDMAIPQAPLTAVNELGQINLINLMKEISKRPFEIYPMIRLAGHFLAAQAALSIVANLVGADFLFPQEN